MSKSIYFFLSQQTVIFLFSFLLVFPSVSFALPILGQEYNVISDVTQGRFFNLDKELIHSDPLADSSYRFDAMSDDYIRFTLNLVTAVGSTQVSMFGTTEDFNNGGDFALRPSHSSKALSIINHLGVIDTTYDPTLDNNRDGYNTPIDALIYINDMNHAANNNGAASDSMKLLGLFAPAASEFDNFGPYTFISAMMNGVFHMDTNKFSIWNAQYASDGTFLGKTDWWLASGGAKNPIPEPASMLLLLSGASGLCFRKRRKSH